MTLDTTWERGWTVDVLVRMNQRSLRPQRILIFSFFHFFIFSFSQAQDLRWWGTAYQEGQTLSYTGVGAADTYHCAAIANAANTMLDGATIHAVRFYLRDKTNVSDVCVWLSKNRPTAGSNADVQVVTVAQEQLKDLEHDQTMLEVPLTTPYTMTSGSVYVGFSFKLSKANSSADKEPLVLAGKGTTASGNCWLKTERIMTAWSDYSSSYGALTIQLRLSNAKLPARAVGMNDLGNEVQIKSTQPQITYRMVNTGFLPVTDVDYVVAVDGTAQPSQHHQLSTPANSIGNTFDVPVTVSVPAANGKHAFTVQITKVNGQANGEADMARGNGTLIALDHSTKHRALVEEFTGTWCIWCPRGILGMTNLARDFGDDFIGICAHYNDPMALPAYSNITPDGLPKSIIDRQVECDPYGGTGTTTVYGIDKDYAKAASRLAEADLSLTAQWTSEQRTAIAYQSTSTFAYDATDGTYAVAYVLTADGLTGTGTGWMQRNAYAGQRNYPADFDFWCKADEYVDGMAYNHVAVATVGLQDGVGGSISPTLVSGQAQTHAGTLDIASNSLVQDKDRLQLIAILLNTSTGQVVNAAKASILPAEADAIANVYESDNGPHWDRTGTALGPQTSSSASSDLFVYTISGQRVVQPTHPGVYIIDNKKVLVK